MLFYHLNFIWLLQHMSEADADGSTISNAPWRNAEQKVFSSRGMVMATQYCWLRSIQKCSQHPLPGTSFIMKCEDRAVEDVKIHERARAVGQMRFRFSSLSLLQRGGWTLVLWVCDQVVILYHTHQPWVVWIQQEKLGTLYWQSSKWEWLIWSLISCCF